MRASLHLVFRLKTHKFDLSNYFYNFVFDFMNTVLNVILRQREWSRRSPQPPLPLRDLVFFNILATVNVRLFGNNCPDLVAIFSTCCTFDITWLDSQLRFLWCTPLKLILLLSLVIAPGVYEIYATNHSPIWNTLGPFTTIACSLCLRQFCEACCKLQSQL